MASSSRRSHPGAIRLGTWQGADIVVTRSWFLIALFIAVLVAPRIEHTEPGIGAWKYAVGLGFAVMLYASVFLHEAAHAVAARGLGLGVSSITLHFLGGYTAIDGEAKRARDEFTIAVVGPLTSIVVGVGSLAAAFPTPPGLLELTLQMTGVANLAVGALNLVPGLPLDGGRVLKAGIWGATGDVQRATIGAAQAGRVVAGVVLLMPFALAAALSRPVDIVDVVTSVMIAWFVWQGATASLMHARIRARVPLLVAQQLAVPVMTVDEHLPLAQALARVSTGHVLVTVTGSGEPVGVVVDAAVEAVPEERRPWVMVASVTRRIGDGHLLPHDIAGEDLLRAITSTPAEAYVLIDGEGRLAGVLTAKAIDVAFRRGVTRG